MSEPFMYIELTRHIDRVQHYAGSDSQMLNLALAGLTEHLTEVDEYVTDLEAYIFVFGTNQKERYVEQMNKLDEEIELLRKILNGIKYENRFLEKGKKSSMHIDYVVKRLRGRLG